MQHIPTDITVDHINRNCLDNHKSNLRLVDWRIQNINQGIKSNNMSGVKGVYFHKKFKSWIATWNDADGNQCSKSFNLKKYGDNIAKAMAIEHHQKIVLCKSHHSYELICVPVLRPAPVTLCQRINHTNGTRPLSETNWMGYMFPAVIASDWVW